MYCLSGLTKKCNAASLILRNKFWQKVFDFFVSRIKKTQKGFLLKTVKNTRISLLDFHVKKAYLNFQKVLFSNNMASASGGAIYVVFCNPQITRTNFTENSARKFFVHDNKKMKFEIIIFIKIKMLFCLVFSNQSHFLVFIQFFSKKESGGALSGKK